MILFNFNAQSELRNWVIVDDVVMGGRSTGSFSLTPEGHGLFKGRVSLENNGGFSSVRHRFASKQVGEFTKVKLRVKGDGKSYQFRLRSSTRDSHAYVATFKTNSAWSTVKIPFAAMYPSFRGQKLKLPNYPGQSMEEIAFLIVYKTAETFAMEIDRIELE
jgi:hypothetical protein